VSNCPNWSNNELGLTFCINNMFVKFKFDIFKTVAAIAGTDGLAYLESVSHQRYVGTKNFDPQLFLRGVTYSTTNTIVLKSIITENQNK
jgi:hypothetical protein